MKVNRVRQRARELAMQFLYSQDMRRQGNFTQAMELFLSLNTRSDDEPAVKEECTRLSAGVMSLRAEIDELLSRVVSGWRLERMVSVDRQILRLMTLEVFKWKELALMTGMTEGRRLAAKYGTEKSACFVSGVMRRVAKYVEAA